MFKVLNAKCECRFQTRPTEPKVEVVKLPGHTVLYDTNSMAAVEVDEQTAQDVAAGKADISLPGQLNFGSKPQFPFYEQSEVRYVVLEATHACNLACVYCFVRNYYPDQGGMMTMETARRAIDMISPKSALSVGFFGGEPLLNWDLIQQVTAYVMDLAAKRGVGKSLHVTTNAILLDDEKIKFLDDNGFSLIVSLDGPEELHNQMRPAKDSSVNSQQATLANLRKFKETKQLKNRTTLRSTYTGLGANLVARLQYLNALIEEGCASYASVEPCSLNETACLRLPDGHPLSITPAHYDALTAEYHAAAEWYVAQVRAGKRPSFHHCMMPMQRILYTQHAASECGAGCGYMAVDPTGQIYGCHRESKSLIGHLDTGVDEELRAKWKDNRLYARPDCLACPIKYVCGGGCRLDSLERHGDIHKPDPTGCFLRRRMFDEALWIMCELGPETLQTIIRNPRENRRVLPGRKLNRPRDLSVVTSAKPEGKVTT
jgi:uncharacterized protein